MKFLFVCLAVLFMVSPAMAGEDPYVSIVGNDISANTFYFSPKVAQFLYDQTALSIPLCFPPNGAPLVTDLSGGTQFVRVGGVNCETFISQTPTNQPEVCDTEGSVCTPPFPDRGNDNAVVRAGNAGFFEWWIRLPKKPSGEINIVVQCGVLKPNAFAPLCYDAVMLCAAETGERIGLGFCTRQEVDPGVSPVQQNALPRLTAVAYPGPYNSFTPFHLTAFKNPSAYTLAFDPVTGAMSNNTNSQVLDGSTNSRILLKSCMDKTVVAKLPVTGQLNACSNGSIPAATPPLPTCFGGGNEAETDLEFGDIIRVRLDIPRQNTVDVYCHAQSARLAGVGEAPF